jgi:RNA polymerase sigma-70 factor (ECF subfamily)
MLAKTKPLLALTAADLMTRNVVQLPQEIPLWDAACLPLQSQLGGASVADFQGSYPKTVDRASPVPAANSYEAQSLPEEDPPEPTTEEEIFRKYAPRIYNLARRMSGNDAEAEDVTQDVFVQVLRHLSTFRGESALSTWLNRIAVNTALASRRKRIARRAYTLAEPIEEFADNDEHRRPVRRSAKGPEQLALDSEAQQMIENAIGQLTETYRDVYVLADVEAQSNADIAELLGLSVPAVKSRLHRARLLMRNLLAPYFEEKTV